MTRAERAEQKLWSNVDGMAQPFYCLGRPKPYFRGTMHFYAALCSPLFSAYQLSLCHTTQQMISVILACTAATCMLGASGAFHYLRWSTVAQEILLGKLDLSAIYLQIAFSATPMYHLLLPPPVNWLIISLMGVCAMCGTLLTFGPDHMGRHARSLVYCIMGCMQVLPMMSSAFAEQSIWSRLLPFERSLVVGLAAAYLIGSQVYAHATPKLWIRVFGFHELWHLLVIIGSASSYIVNCSLLKRLATITD